MKRPHVKGILAQKPVAFTLDEAVEMVRLCDEAGVKLGVNHNMRYDQSMRALQSLLAADELGEPVVAEIVMNARPHWQEFIKPYGRIALLNMSIHHLDAFRYQFGDPERILVSVRQRPEPRLPAQGRHGVLRSSSTRTGCGRSASTTAYTWVDHGIQWRVEGTEGIAKGTIGWPDYPNGSPSDHRPGRRGRWTGPGSARAGRSSGSLRRSRAPWGS